MVEQLQDLISAITEATISKRLKWEYCGRWRTEDVDSENEKPGLKNSIFESVWGSDSLKIYREGDTGIISIAVENSQIRIKLSDETLPVLEIPLSNLYVEIYYSLDCKEGAVKSALKFIDELTLSLLC